MTPMHQTAVLLTGLSLTSRQKPENSPRDNRMQKYWPSVLSRVIPAQAQEDIIRPAPQSGQHTIMCSGYTQLIWILHSRPQIAAPVSYTHLTLPTNREV